MAGLQYNWIRFSQERKYDFYLHVLKLQNPNQSNWRPAVQRYFPYSECSLPLGYNSTCHETMRVLLESLYHYQTSTRIGQCLWLSWCSDRFQNHFESNRGQNLFTFNCIENTKIKRPGTGQLLKEKMVKRGGVMIILSPSSCDARNSVPTTTTTTTTSVDRLLTFQVGGVLTF